MNASPSISTHTSLSERERIADHSTAHAWAHGHQLRSKSNASDLWSAAYHEAIKSLGDNIDIAILKASSIDQLFKRLEEIGKDATQESIFLRGVKYLHDIQVPLERFKLALDLATPLSRLEPTAATVFGVVSSVTAVGISTRICAYVSEATHSLTGLNADCHQLGNGRLSIREADRRNARTSVLH